MVVGEGHAHVGLKGVVYTHTLHTIPSFNRGTASHPTRTPPVPLPVIAIAITTIDVDRRQVPHACTTQAHTEQPCPWYQSTLNTDKDPPTNHSLQSSLPLPIPRSLPLSFHGEHPHVTWQRAAGTKHAEERTVAPVWSAWSMLATRGMSSSRIGSTPFA